MLLAKYCMSHLLARRTIATCSICVWPYCNRKDIGREPHTGGTAVQPCCGELY